MAAAVKSSKARVWWMAFRYHFVPPSIFPAVLGGLVSWATGSGFIPFYFAIVLAAIIVNHVALNMTDDYYDYKHSVDKLAPGEKNPYSGGSGTLSSGLLTPKTMFKAFSFCYLIVLAAGLYLAFACGFPILAFGLFGVFCAVFYTAPPISFSHHGLGELALLVNFGSIIGLGAFYVQARTITLQAFAATLPLGIMLFSMIVINEIPDVAEDTAAGKLTLVARYGKEAGVKLYVASWACTYAVIAASAVLGVIPLYALAGLISLPLVIRSIGVLRVHLDDPRLMAPANLDMIRAHSLTAFGLIGGYAAAGLLRGANQLQLGFALGLLAAAYAPVAWTLLSPKTTPR